MGDSSGQGGYHSVRSSTSGGRAVPPALTTHRRLEKLNVVGIRSGTHPNYLRGAGTRNSFERIGCNNLTREVGPAETIDIAPSVRNNPSTHVVPGAMAFGGYSLRMLPFA